MPPIGHFRTFALLALLSALLPQAALAAPADWAIPGGRFFTQTGGPSGQRGYAVTDADGVRFWEAFQTLGGVQAVGYPVSSRFVHGGFVTQAMQKAVFQWRPETGSVSLVNVFDDLARADRNDWLLSARSTPRPLPPEFDAGHDWATIVRERTALLDARPAIRRRYLAVPDPILMYGLPTSRVEDMGNHYAVRLQRAVIQEWKVDVPWARAGETTVANGGDILKEAGLIPAEATWSGGAAPTAGGDARLVVESATVHASPGGPIVASIFRNAQVELTGQTTDDWVGVRLWNALAGWLPRQAVSIDPYPTQDTAPGTRYRRPIPPRPAAPVPVPVDVAAIATRTENLRSEPLGESLGTVQTGQPLRVDSYRRDTNGATWFRVWLGYQPGWLPAAAVTVQARDPQAPLSDGVVPWAVVAGKGMWATYDLLERVSAQSVVETMRVNGISHLYFQVGRSNLGFYGGPGLDQLLPLAHASGIRVVGWVYPFLRDTVADVKLTADAIRYSTPDGHRIDALAADIEENTAADEVHAYGQLVRALAGDDVPLIVATYPPQMDRGRTYPFAVVARTWNVIAPMDYYRSPSRRWSAADAARYITTSIQGIREMAGRSVAVAPIGQAYGIGWPNETGPTNPTAEETRAMLRAAKEAGAVGISFFEWAHGTAPQWREIGAYSW